MCLSLSLYLEFLILYFLADGIEFAVVADVLLLFVVFGYLYLRLFGVLLGLFDLQVEFVDSALDIVYARLESCHFVFEVLYLGREHPFILFISSILESIFWRS